MPVLITAPSVSTGHPRGPLCAPATAPPPSTPRPTLGSHSSQAQPGVERDGQISQPDLTGPTQRGSTQRCGGRLGAARGGRLRIASRPVRQRSEEPRAMRYVNVTSICRRGGPGSGDGVGRRRSPGRGRGRRRDVVIPLPDRSQTSELSDGQTRAVRDGQDFEILYK